MLKSITMSSKNFIVTVLLILFATMIMVIPVLANSSNWAFTGTVEGRYLNGGNNGVYHNMTAGTLTNSGSIWVTYASPGASNLPQNWTFEVWKDYRAASDGRAVSGSGTLSTPASVVGDRSPLIYKHESSRSLPLKSKRRGMTQPQARDG